MDRIFKFLLGEGEIDGCNFGDKHIQYKGLFWWRKLLREYLETHPTCTPNERAFLDEIREKGREFWDDRYITFSSFATDYGTGTQLDQDDFESDLSELVNKKEKSTEKLKFKFERQPDNKVHYKVYQGSELLFVFYLLPKFKISAVRFCRKRAREKT